ncbi:MAG: oligosaccharide flippase family protein [Candidatus Bathyarchaeota archaeon]|nr:oligosaccharide flippase family protein [Candidatus Bathyarchaeota archaeon]
MIRGSARGSIVLLVGQVASNLLAAVGVIWVTSLLGDVSLGEVTVVYVPATIVLLFQDLGLNAAMTRFSALWRHEGRMPDLKVLLRTGLLLNTSMAVVLSLAMWLAAPLIAEGFLQEPALVLAVRAVSLVVLGQAMMNSTQAVLVGLEHMHLKSLANVVWAVLKTVSSVGLVLIGLGPLGAVAGGAIAVVLTGALGMILIYLTLRLVEGGRSSLSQGEALRILLGFGFPYYTSTLIAGGLAQVYSSLMTLYITRDFIGNYAAATNFGVLVSFLTMPIGTVLFPLLSKIPRGSPNLKKVFQNAVKYTAFITLPVALGLIVVAGSLIDVIYPGQYPFAAEYLKVYLVLFVFEGLGGLSLGNLIVAMGETRVILWSNMITFVVGVPLSLFLIPTYGINGMLITMIAAPKVCLLYQLWWVKKTLGFSVNWGSSARLYASALGSFVVAYPVSNMLGLGGWGGLLSGVAVYGLLYLIISPLIGALTRSDIADLDQVVDVAGPFARPLRVVLGLIGRLAR